jgi:hypothetical protein
MVQVNIPIAFGVSCFFTDMARRQLQQGGPIYYYHTFSQTVIFQAFFFSWIPLYFLMNFLVGKPPTCGGMLMMLQRTLFLFPFLLFYFGYPLFWGFMLGAV